jgi:hypothetical protein
VSPSRWESVQKCAGDDLKCLLAAVCDDRRRVVMTVASEGFLPLVLNLAASWRAAGIDNTFVVAQDAASADVLRSFRIPTFSGTVPLTPPDIAASREGEGGLQSSPSNGLATDHALIYGTVAFSSFTQRTNAVHRAIIAAGYTVVFSDADTVWLANIFDEDAWGPEPRWEAEGEAIEQSVTILEEGAAGQHAPVNPHLGHACGALRLGDVVTPLGEQKEALLSRTDCVGGLGGQWRYDVKGMCELPLAVPGCMHTPGLPPPPALFRWRHRRL